MSSQGRVLILLKHEVLPFSCAPCTKVAMWCTCLKKKKSRVKANARTFTHYKLPIVPDSMRAHTHAHKSVKGLTPLQLHTIFNIPPRLLRCVVVRIAGSAPWTFNPNVLFVSVGPPLSRLTRRHTLWRTCSLSVRCRGENAATYIKHVCTSLGAVPHPSLHLYWVLHPASHISSCIFLYHPLPGCSGL